MDQICFKNFASYPEQTIPSNFANLASNACFLTNSFIDFVWPIFLIDEFEISLPDPLDRESWVSLGIKNTSQLQDAKSQRDAAKALAEAKSRKKNLQPTKEVPLEFAGILPTNPLADLKAPELPDNYIIS